MRRVPPVVLGLTLGIALSAVAETRSPIPPAWEGEPPALAPCADDDELLCGSYPVWENRATGKGRKIELNVVVLPATGTSKASDPIFWFHGGPGAPATALVGAAGRGRIARLRRSRDYVLVDQRGTGGSHPLGCEIPTETLGDLFTPSVARIPRFRARLTPSFWLSRNTFAPRPRATPAD